MLHWIGFDRAAVLDGGWPVCRAVSGPVGNYPEPAAKTRFLPATKRNLFIARQQLDALLAEDAVLIDALSSEQFSGCKAELGLKGYIPGAINIPAESLLNIETGCIYSNVELASRLPVDLEKPIVVYCGRGIAASIVVFVLLKLGAENVFCTCLDCRNGVVI